MSDSTDDPRQWIHRALDGDEEALDELLGLLLPPIHRQVAVMLRRWRKGAAAARDARQELEDLAQEVLLHLFEKDGTALRAWKPERASLATYVGHIARARTAMVLRSPRSPWREHPMADEDFPQTPDPMRPEHAAAVRDLWERIYLCLVGKFTPEDALRFELRFVQELSLKEIAQLLGLEVNTLHQWLSRRLRKLARACREKVMTRTRRDAEASADVCGDRRRPRRRPDGADRGGGAAVLKIEPLKIEPLKTRPLPRETKTSTPSFRPRTTRFCSNSSVAWRDARPRKKSASSGERGAHPPGTASRTMPRPPPRNASTTSSSVPWTMLSRPVRCGR